MTSRALTSIADPDPYVFEPPESGSVSQRYGYGSGSGPFYHQAKIERKTLNPTVCNFFKTYLLKNDVNVASKSSKQKKFENSRIRIRTNMSRIRNTGWRRGSILYTKNPGNLPAY
jgi:hypothetical protein